MERYLFELHCQNSDLTYSAEYHQEMLEPGSAKIRAQQILKDGKRDKVAYSISVYRKNHGDWKKLVTLQ